MKRKTKMNLQTSIWTNKNFDSSLLSSYNPEQSGWLDFGAVEEPKSHAKTNRKTKRAAMHPQLSVADRTVEDLSVQFDSMAVKSNKVSDVASDANAPFFASNLKFYPHLVQPTKVAHYQTYAEVMKLWEDGKYSKFETPSRPLAGMRRYDSIEHDVPDEPPKPAPNRRYSVNRRKAVQPQPAPEVQNPLPPVVESTFIMPTTSTSKGAIPKQPKKFAVI